MAENPDKGPFLTIPSLLLLTAVILCDITVNIELNHLSGDIHLSIEELQASYLAPSILLFPVNMASGVALKAAACCFAPVVDLTRQR